MHNNENLGKGTCSPIRSLTELNEFIKNPPFWSTLVIPRSRRSDVIRNFDLYQNGNICHLFESEIKQPMRYEYGFLPKTLVCHDMMNGYKDDCHIGGTDNFAAYTFYNWSGIDIFVYFSHHFITIPPLGWINAAHKHGVQMLGTIITEWEDGFKICQEFLQSEESMQTFVHNLVTVAKHLKFDGWLINIENKVEKVEMLTKFVKYLTDCMHSEIPESVIIWYDSVINTGELKWQNCLNNQNRDFFDACDGIFTNYCWGEEELQRCVEEAGKRRIDIYVGVDVWGRNFWGGGCLNTVEAVKVIHKYKLSMAIFAPAWTHEGIKFKDLMEQQYEVEKYNREDSCAAKLSELTEGDNKSIKNQFFMRCAVREHFILRDIAFWNTIWPYLNTRGPSQLPFQTFFCLGSGNKKRIDGEIVDGLFWFDLSEQEYQLSIPFCSNNYKLEKVNIKETKSELKSNEVSQESSSDTTTAKPEEVSLKDITRKPRKPPIVIYHVKPNTVKSKCILPHVEESYKGGSCLKILPIKTENVEKHIARLFICEFLCDYNFIVYYIFKPELLEQDFNLYVTLKDNRTKSAFQVVLCGSTNNDKQAEGVIKVNPLRETDHDKFKKLQMDLVLNQSQFYIPVNNDQDWKIRYFVLEYPNTTILEISCGLTNSNGHVLLGGLGITRDIPL